MLIDFLQAAAVRVPFIGSVGVLLFISFEAASCAQDDPKLPSEILERPDAHYEGPFRAYPDRIIDRRPSILIFPGDNEDSVLPGGVLSRLKDYPKITGLRLYAGPKTSEVSSDSFVVEITPEAVADIGALAHLESLDITNVDLTRGDGLKFLESMKNLRELRIDNCAVELSDVLAHLRVCRRLNLVRLFYVPKVKAAESPLLRRVMTAGRIRKLVDDSPELSILFLQMTEQYEPAAIAHFARLKSLNQLHITYSYHQWTLNKSLVEAERPPANARQEAEARKLEALFQANKMRRWRDPGLDMTYRLPARIVYIAEGAANPHP